ncbi:MAG TPA: DNA repair protein RadA, partial [Candidatus Marinimicrobia bacterium]|nr:DNA repair protein RadA [Candidatus Neomarinimicrobiota bacterium]
FNRVTGGGLIPGAVILLGGDPGIGKSTLALQLISDLFRNSRLKGIYFSGEESVEQVSLRAARLQIVPDEFAISQDMDLGRVIAAIKEEKPQFVIIDSIQTIYSPNGDALPGTISQIRECAVELMNLAKQQQCIILMIGHITKDGNLAGPKLLEHLVDTVLYLEGDNQHGYRILRPVKNRFGATNDIGIFEMKQNGLHSVENPGELFLSERPEELPGSIIACGADSSRPLLVEVQALTARAAYGSPQRNATGIDGRRLAMLLAIIERHLRLPVSQFDVFVNVVGGLKFFEPAMDLPVIAAILSSMRETPAPESSVFCGEAGLTGEIRSVNLMERRIEEAERLGFKRLYIPKMKNFNPNRRIEIRLLNALHELEALF